MTDIKTNWAFYTDWLKSMLPVYAGLLNPGASETELAELENYLGFSLPENVKALYRLNNGDASRDTPRIYVGAFLGFEFLSLARIRNVHSEWKQHAANNYSGSSFPEGSIRVQYTNEKWIPLFADSGGNYVGIDLDPDKNGIAGQVINFGRAEDNKFVIAQNLDDFLEFVGKQIKSGACDNAITEEDDGGSSYGLSPQSHLIDDLKGIFLPQN
ncbi:MAG: Cell wall assembly/cell proliferation coordinating protein, KNR4 [Bacteroidetes bacterium]|nr:MAG: Cell wall assembly/cell proliferation coordinating protein, KNR4 [Bacteroidota bacterium]